MDMYMDWMWIWIGLDVDMDWIGLDVDVKFSPSVQQVKIQYWSAKQEHDAPWHDDDGVREQSPHGAHEVC